MSHNRPFLGNQLRPRQGIPAGLFAGIVMALVYGALAQVFDSGADQLLNTIAATFLGGDAVAAGWQPFPLGVGLLTHLVVAVLLGLLFAASLDHLDRGETLVVSTFYGFTIWFVASFIVGGWFNDSIVMLNRSWIGLLAHLTFGFCLGLYASARRTTPPTLSPD